MILEAALQFLGLKKLPFLAGLLGGAISAGVMPGPLAALTSHLVRMTCGALCGGIIAGYGAEPLALAFQRPEYSNGIAFGLGFVGLSFFFKVLGGLNSVDFGAIITSYLRKGPK